MVRLWITLAAVLVASLVAAGAWTQLPPHSIVMATGPEGGAYYKFGLDYANALRRDNDVTVVVLPTRGSVDNLALLHDPWPKVIELIRDRIIGEKKIQELLAAGAVSKEDAQTLRAELQKSSSQPSRSSQTESNKIESNQIESNSNVSHSLHVSAALVQGGTISSPCDASGLATLGTAFLEPLWLFWRKDVNGDGLDGLKDKTVAVGRDGSGTQRLARELLQQHGITGETGGSGKLRPQTIDEDKDGEGNERNEGRKALLAGEIDAAFAVASWKAPNLQKLLHDEHVKLGGYPQAEAYAALYPYLHRVVLPRGTIDLANNTPREDVSLIAAKASVIVRNDLHSATQYLLLNATKQIHGAQSVLQRAGEFPAAEAVTVPAGESRPGCKSRSAETADVPAGESPSAEGVNVPLSAAAQQFYNSSIPYFLNNFLRNYLPFWIAEPIYALIPILLLVGALGFLRPLIRPLPILVNWWIQRPVFQLLFDLVTLDEEARAAGDVEAIKNVEVKLNELERRANDLRRRHMPASIAALLYILLQHIDALRQRLQRDIGGVRPG
jgi:TRAP-type uncharacterized transport system substrate-binding protein